MSGASAESNCQKLCAADHGGGVGGNCYPRLGFTLLTVHLTAVACAPHGTAKRAVSVNH